MPSNINRPTGTGQNIIIKYLQQILIVAIIGFGSWLFNLIGKLQEENASKDNEITMLKEEIKTLQRDLLDDENDIDGLRNEIEDVKDNHNTRIVRLEDCKNCK